MVISELADSNTTADDGYCELDVLRTNGQTADDYFDRLPGDVAVDGVVNDDDLNAIAAELGPATLSGMTPLNADVTGDGSVTPFDLKLTTRSKGRRQGVGLSPG